MVASRSSVQRFAFAAGFAVAVLDAAAAPAPAAGVDPGTVTPHPVTATLPMGGSSTAAPALSAISVQPSGTGAVIQFTSSEPTSAAVSVKPTVTTAAPSSNAPVAGLGSGILAPTSGTNADPDTPPPTFETNHQLTLTNLKSNTAYDATVSAQTRGGTNLSGHVQFHTAKERIRATVDSIDLQDDDAIYGGTDANWSLGLRWRPGPGYHSPLASGSATTCFPHFSNEGCVYGHYDEVVPSN
jgi:hypothetical protein